MGIPKKGSRNITVDGQSYRWFIRKKHTLTQVEIGGITILVQSSHQAKLKILIGFAKRPENDFSGYTWIWVNLPWLIITPHMVRQLILHAIKQGWDTNNPSQTYLLHIQSKRELEPILNLASKFHFDHIIGDLKPLSADDVDVLQSQTLIDLPLSYRAFLQAFGYGNINEIILISEPDTDYMKNNFADMLDYWDWGRFKAHKDGVMISKTIDGDVILAISYPGTPFLILPRDGGNIQLYETFEQIIEHYANYYHFEQLYFDSDWQSEMQFINLTENPPVDNTPPVFQKFLDHYCPDVQVGSQEQPKFVLKNIGGWVSFSNLAHNPFIRIKYQKPYENQALAILNFLKS